MKNNYFKMILIACIIFTTTGYSNAQMSINKDRRDHQSLVTDLETGLATFTLNNTSTRNSSRWYYNDDQSIGVKFEKTRNEKGWQSEVFTADGTVIYNDDFKVRGWNRNENPVHAHSIDSLKACLDKWQEINGGSDANTFNKPSACDFDVNGDPKEQAFGTHPGMYKRVEYGYYFKFSGYLVSSDIEFEMWTYDAGNTGKTASYDLVVAIGSTDDVVATVPGVYVTGQAKKTIKVAEAAGLDYNDFAGENVYFWLKTVGTGTPIAEGTYDPTVVFDNMTVSYQLPVWISPAAGAAANSILSNEENPLVAPADLPVLDSLHIQLDGRQGSLTIVDDLGDRKYGLILNFNFMETGALKANDGNGNYTVDVPYILEPAVWSDENGQWSNAKITVASDATTVDDMMFYFYATPTSSALHAARLEMDCGVRIWYDFFMQGIAPELDTLAAAVGTLSPAFDPAKMDYALNVPKGTSSISFSASTSEEGASVVFPDVTGLADGTDVVATVETKSKHGHATGKYNVHIHVQAEEEIMYLSANNDDLLLNARGFDVNPVQLLKDAGYSITFSKKDALNGGNFDYSPYAAIVMAPGNSSSNIVQFAKDGYQIPVVCMQPDAPRSDKWGWTGSKKSDGKQMFVSKEYNSFTAQMIVNQDGNYITNDWEGGRVLKWTNGTVDSADWKGREIKAYNLNDSIPRAIKLGFIPTVWDNRMGSWWAVPANTSIRSVTADGSLQRITLGQRVVLLNLFSDGLLYPGEFLPAMLTKSLEWVLGAGGTLTDAAEIGMNQEVNIYPNPAKNYAKVKVVLQESQNVSLSLINMVGQKIEVTTNQRLMQGVNEMDINTSNLKEGIYIYVLETEHNTFKGKLNIAR